jgi:excisionase family DNA binding protein
MTSRANLSVSRAWVYEAARTGRIPSVRLGGEEGPLRFVEADIDQWVRRPELRGIRGRRAS